MTRMTRPDCAVMCNLINTHTHQCEWHRMTRMTGPDCVVMCNLINTHTHTPFKEKAAMVQKYSEKATSPNKQKEKRNKELRVAIGTPAYRRTIERRAAASRKHKDENEAKQNKRKTRERRHDICKPNDRRIQVRATCV